MKFFSILIIVLWLLGAIAMVTGSPSLALTLWSFPAGWAVGTAILELYK